MRRRAVLLAVALAAALLPAPAAVAKTGVTVDGTVVTFHVPIDVVGMAGQRFRYGTLDADAAARLLEDDANKLWNDQLADLPFLDCFTFRIDIDLNPVPGGHRSEEGRHRIGYQREPTFRSYVNWPPGSPTSGDSSTLYQGSVDGEWDMWAVPHEVGHLLGLDDDYTDVGGDKPGREGTIMAGGEVVDQNIVDRLGELVGEVEDLPLCETWTGSFSMSRSDAFCEESSGGEIHVSVVLDPLHVVTATVTESGSSMCSQPEFAFAGSGSFELAGTFEDNKFVFTQATAVTGYLGIHGGWICFPEPVAVGVDSPGAASADWTAHPGIGPTSCQMTLERVD